MQHSQAITPGEPIRYTGERHTWNNGFRRRWLDLGKRDAEVINAARRGDLQTVLARVRTMGGVRGGIGIARSIIQQAQRLEADVPAHRIVRREDGERTVCVPHLSWAFAGRRQVGTIEWQPIWSVPLSRRTIA